MGKYFYPPINPQNLRQVRELVKAHKQDYLDNPDCPYPDDLKLLFAKLFDVQTASGQNSNDKNSAPFTEEDLSDSEFLDKELNKLYAELKEFGKKLDIDSTASERNTYFKLSTTLIEKVISSKEKLNHIKEVEFFMDTVLEAMDDILNSDQREKFLDRIHRFTLDYKPVE